MKRYRADMAKKGREPEREKGGSAGGWAQDRCSSHLNPLITLTIANIGADFACGRDRITLHNFRGIQITAKGSTTTHPHTTAHTHLQEEKERELLACQ